MALTDAVPEPLITPERLLDLIRMAADRADTHAEFCAAVGCSPTYLSHVLHGRARPGKKFLDYLGYEPVLYFGRKGE